MPYVYRIWRGVGFFWLSRRLEVEVRVAPDYFFWWFFDTLKYSSTRYTDFGALGVSVSVTTNAIHVPLGFTG